MNKRKLFPFFSPPPLPHFSLYIYSIDGGGFYYFYFVTSMMNDEKNLISNKRKEKKRVSFIFYDVIISNIFISSPSRLPSTTPCPSVLCVSQCAQLKLSTRARTAPLSWWMVKVYNEPALYSFPYDDYYYYTSLIIYRHWTVKCRAIQLYFISIFAAEISDSCVWKGLEKS